MRPSVTIATRCPRSSSAPSGAVSLCSSGMPFAAGPWKRITATKSRPSSSPAWNAASRSAWSSKTSAGASITRCSGLTAETLLTARPRLPESMRMPPSGANGSATGRSTAVSVLPSARSSQTSSPSLSTGAHR